MDGDAAVPRTALMPAGAYENENRRPDESSRWHAVSLVGVVGVVAVVAAASHCGVTGRDGCGEALLFLKKNDIDLRARDTCECDDDDDDEDDDDEDRGWWWLLSLAPSAASRSG